MTFRRFLSAVCSVLALVGTAFLGTPVSAAAPPSFAHEIVPTLYKLGCSAGECHGSFSGKGGFRLSLFAADAPADDLQIHGIFDRRIDRQSPAESLLLTKPTMKLAHGGGLRLKPDSAEYALLLKWIESGARSDHATAPAVVSVEVEPPMVIVAPKAAPAAVRVFARFADGSRRDVTPFARFESLDSSLATVDATGSIGTLRVGDAYVLVHYAGQMGRTSVLAPGPATELKFPEEKIADPIDRMLVDKLRQLNIVPSPAAGDYEFVRCAYLDVVGRLPTADETRAFVADKKADKRAALVDKLLADPLHAAVWATEMCDVMGADNRTMYDQSVYRIHDWMRNRFERNVPWDKIVEGALTGTVVDGRSLDELKKENERLAEIRKREQEAQKAGQKFDKTQKLADKPWRTGPALRNTLEDFSYNLKFRVQAGPRKGRMDPKPLAQHVATAFLGVRLECAECHKHPHDRWSQQDFFSFTTAFAFLDRGLAPEMRAEKLNFINGTFVTTEPQETFPDPKTGEVLPPRPLDGPEIKVTAGVDPRHEVWKWMVAPENPYFARAMVNRVWAHYMGRGLIEPVDALSEANPPTHPEVLAELERDFRGSKFDLRRLHRRILNLVAYSRAWQTNATNSGDESNYSHRVLKRMQAELVLDAVADVTGTGLKLDQAIYFGPGDDRQLGRAIEYPLSRPRGDDSYVMKIFDKPQRTQSCDCERSSAPNLSQALFFFNDTALATKISDPNGRLARRMKEETNDDKLLDDLYLTTLTRLPTDDERRNSHEYVRQSKSRVEAFEDLQWSLLNRREFIVSH
jgi:hypothetical protein